MWYERHLSAKPSLLQQAERRYIGENDLLGSFIAEHCETGGDFKVETPAFKQAFEVYSESKMKFKALGEKMAARGFLVSRKRFASDQNPKHAFLGIKLLM